MVPENGFTFWKEKSYGSWEWLHFLETIRVMVSENGFRIYGEGKKKKQKRILWNGVSEWVIVV
jgi:hypothetical protein